MSAHSEILGSIRPHRKQPHPAPERPPSADHFVKVHQSHVPWEGEGIDLHEDERYEALAEAEEERVPGLYERFRILYGDERPGPESRA